MANPLRPHEYSIYAFLTENSGSRFSASEIAENTNMDNRTAKKLVEVLVKKKIIKKVKVRDNFLYYNEA